MLYYCIPGTPNILFFNLFTDEQLEKYGDEAAAEYYKEQEEIQK